tara:strand:- start:1340 stop:1969 length:630 start_codon:yes stop_codon:yes gene_type:complete
VIKYKIIDNFLDEDDFKNLSSIDIGNVSKSEIKIFHNKIFNNGVIENSCLKKNDVKKLFDNYHDKALKMLEDFNPAKVPLWDYSEFHITITGSDYIYPIHRDSPYKLLSGVIYLAPADNKGTILYDNKKGENMKEIEWKQNRGLFFSRSENNSYHSYQGDKKSTRLTLVYNLMTTNLKEVCNIEKTNYSKIKIREYLNPYLYRFFKKVL